MCARVASHSITINMDKKGVVDGEGECCVYIMFIHNNNAKVGIEFEIFQDHKSSSEKPRVCVCMVFGIFGIVWWCE